MGHERAAYLQPGEWGALLVDCRCVSVGVDAGVCEWVRMGVGVGMGEGEGEGVSGWLWV